MLGGEHPYKGISVNDIIKVYHFSTK